MNKTYLILIIITFFAGVIAWSFLQDDTAKTAQQPEHKTHNHQKQELRYIPGPNPEDPLSTGVDMFKEDSPSEKVEEIASVTEKDSIVWQESDEAERVLKELGVTTKDLKNEAYVEIDRAELVALEAGDFIDLYIPQIGGSYTGEVDAVRVRPNGNRTVEAAIPGAGRLYSAVITITDNAIYATLGTQSDTYSMEGVGNYAWIASRSDLESNHVEIIPGTDNNNSHSAEAEPIFLEPADN
ncbi:hypothetical protein OE749_06665 [Aestuariibacter sp. AA17]|uniref:Flp pilus assembly protein CpaB n=1 Tax=Fluctibacter corallii TaxID=2984329 RepID=A0ABT3A6Q5_9ALTE|nr:hypothetical protein [Aestuariibacter sp. AA17]MCV2884373.1 hypothetical protein [Aestuariibacter sp. AA17]